jgi:hypothetical protein
MGDINVIDTLYDTDVGNWSATARISLVLPGNELKTRQILIGLSNGCVTPFA